MNNLDRIKNLLKKFTKQTISLAIAESCTGGYISHMITNISGASNVFERAIISYSNKSKIELLNISPKSLKIHGAVSEDIARQMASNIRKLSDVDIGIGITGIAGPTGGSPEKPVGLVYIGFSTKNSVKVMKFNIKAERIKFKKLVLEKIIGELEKFTL